MLINSAAPGVTRSTKRWTPLAVFRLSAPMTAATGKRCIFHGELGLPVFWELEEISAGFLGGDRSQISGAPNLFVNRNKKVIAIR